MHRDDPRPPGVLVIRDDDAFNFSRLNNAAVARARGGIDCLLNDGTEVLAAEWLDEMVGFATLDGVGAVGARLWYPDGTLQHGGVVLDPTVVATHAFVRYPRGDAGYSQRAVIQREVSAVTAVRQREGIRSRTGPYWRDARAGCRGNRTRLRETFASPRHGSGPWRPKSCCCRESDRR